MTASKLIKTVTKVSVTFDCGLTLNKAKQLLDKSGVYYEKRQKTLSMNIRPSSDDSLIELLRLIGVKG